MWSRRASREARPDSLVRILPILVNEAALFAARANVRTVGMQQFELAKDKIMMGAERRSMVMSENREAEYGLSRSRACDCRPIDARARPGLQGQSLFPRGRALGVTMFLPEEDRYSHSRRHIVSQICSLFGGRIAEEMTLGQGRHNHRRL